jgi:hypothetical protein
MNCEWLIIPLSILAWYLGRTLLIYKQKQMGLYRHCDFCGKKLIDDPYDYAKGFNTEMFKRVIEELNK